MQEIPDESNIRDGENGFDPFEASKQAVLRERSEEAFRPSAPIDNKEQLAGRVEQFQRLGRVLGQLGRHAVIYGERGVGKTSLARVLQQHVPSLFTGAYPARTACSPDDDFTAIWRRLLRDLGRGDPATGFTAAIGRTAEEAASGPDEKLTPADVVAALRKRSSVEQMVLIIDDLDQVEDDRTRYAIGSSVKLLSDEGVRATVVLVGVADSVTELIAKHPSAERVITQVHMPRLSPEELREILDRGLERMTMSVDEHVLSRIIALSQGFPHYTHLLGQEAAVAAWETKHVTDKELEIALQVAVENREATLHETYVRAVGEPQDARLRDVLLATALTTPDPHGYFTADGVRTRFTSVLANRVGPAGCADELRKLSAQRRGRVLQRSEHDHPPRLRFTDPLLRPYVVLLAIAEGRLSYETVEEASVLEGSASAS